MPRTYLRTIVRICCQGVNIGRKPPLTLAAFLLAGKIWSLLEAGSALGIATARFVLNRQAAESRGSVQFQPMKDGWQIAYSIRTH